MKTTIDLSDALFESAKELARSSHTSLRALIEEGLRRVLHEAQTQPEPSFKLKDARVHGGATLVADPRQWREMEEAHVAAAWAVPPSPTRSSAAPE